MSIRLPEVTKAGLGAAAVLGLALSGMAWAADTTTQTVTAQVDAINEIAVSGNPATLVVGTATAGQQPNDATDATTTYDITTNETNKKIAAAIDAALTTGLTLTVNLAAPTGAASTGAVTLGTVAEDAVTGLTEVAATGNTITYTLSADVTAGTVAAETRTVTFTIVDGT